MRSVRDFESGTTRMIVPVTHYQSAPAIGDIGEMQTEHLAGSEAAIEHQAHDRQVTPAAQLGYQLRDLLGVERARRPACCPDFALPGWSASFGRFRSGKGRCRSDDIMALALR